METKQIIIANGRVGGDEERWFPIFMANNQKWTIGSGERICQPQISNISDESFRIAAEMRKLHEIDINNKCVQTEKQTDREREREKCPANDAFHETLKWFSKTLDETSSRRTTCSFLSRILDFSGMVLLKLLFKTNQMRRIVSRLLKCHISSFGICFSIQRCNESAACIMMHLSDRTE